MGKRLAVGVLAVVVCGGMGVAAYVALRDPPAGRCRDAKAAASAAGHEATRLAHTLHGSVTTTVTLRPNYTSVQTRPEAVQMARALERQAIVAQQNPSCFSPEKRADIEQEYREAKPLLPK